GYLLGSA
nr:Chain A, PrP peptide [synthetic construct]4W71_B Chain B, PrP peptide [synthetic construct]